MEKLEGCILSFAEESIGQQEIEGNMGFVDPVFDEEMRELGRFQNGFPWCVCFVEMCWKKGYRDFNIKESEPIFKEMAKLITPSAKRTLENFKEADAWIISQTPRVGAIAIWIYYKNGNPTSSGHAGIVKSWNYKRVTTIDGNTNAEGGREGKEVAEKSRRKNFHDTKGLVLQGFIWVRD